MGPIALVFQDQHAWRLYYAKIGIGTPPKNYYMQVDTGNDITWVNCIQCTECPKRGYHGIELTLYNPNESLTSELVSCDQPFCLEVNGGSPFPVCKTNYPCTYAEFYGDGSSTTGYFVKDIVQYDQVSGDLQTTTANGSVGFGLTAIARKRPGQYGRILPALLDFHLKLETSREGHLASLQYSVKSALLGFLRCTHPAISEDLIFIVVRKFKGETSCSFYQ